MSTPGPKEKKGICFIFKRNVTHVTHRRTMRTLVIASAERLKKLFLQAKFTRTLCIRSKHVPNDINSALVILPIRGDCATHCNGFQIFHTCLQRNFGSCRDGEFRDG